MYRNLFLFLLLLPLVACVQLSPAPDSVTVSGKVSRNQAGVAGVQVMAYPADTVTLDGPAPHVSPPSGADGRFTLQLPPDEYYFLARGAGFFSYYGRNPVAVPPSGLDELNVGLVAAEVASLEGEPFVATGVMGRVLHEGKPLAGATVFVYTDLTSRLKGMGYAMAGPTDASGFFEAALPAGTYYLLARLRHGPAGVGPLRSGDFVGYYDENPITVGEGEVANIAIAMLEVPTKVDRMEASLFGSTTVRGRILDAEGRPVSGARAVLYDDPQMFNRPLYVSQPTGVDGAYVLSFPYGGTYYLAARDTLGGAPGPGDLYGTYDGTPDHSLQLESGESRTGIDIMVEEMW